MGLDADIDRFLACERFAVVGASTDRDKYGNKVLRAFLQAGKTATPVNPKVSEVENVPAFPSLSACPDGVEAVSIITPPAVTNLVVQQAIELGVAHVWLQPGAESDDAIRACQQAGINLIHSGPCVLVSLGFREQ